LSQGAKPGHGGILPAAKITPEIAKTRGVPMGVDCVSPSRHTAFNHPVEMLEFISLLREKSNGKPVGFKLCIGRPEEWFAILKAMLETKLIPDFIVVDGSEGGTGAAPVEFVDHIGMPMRDSLRLIHTTLNGAKLRSNIRIGAAGKIISAFDMVRVFALGADWCNSARGFMFAIGCIQSRTCNTDMCPTGVATQNLSRQRALDPVDKGTRVFHFHQNTLHALAEILSAAGMRHPSELSPDNLMRRDEQGVAQPFSKNMMQMNSGALLSEVPDQAFKDDYAYLAGAWSRSQARAW
jgi:glutamate synthase domain-containing protein 2